MATAEIHSFWTSSDVRVAMFDRVPMQSQHTSFFFSVELRAQRTTLYICIGECLLMDSSCACVYIPQVTLLMIVMLSLFRMRDRCICSVEWNCLSFFV